MTGKAPNRLTRARNGPNGKPDSGIIFKIKQYLRKEYQIDFVRIKTDCAIKFTGRGYKLLEPAGCTARRWLGGLIHTPDIAITDEHGGLVAVIEQDGRIHDTRKHAEKDEVRNRHYGNAGIPLIVISSSVIRAEKTSLGAYLDREMRRIGIVRPARHTRRLNLIFCFLKPQTGKSHEARARRPGRGRTSTPRMR